MLKSKLKLLANSPIKSIERYNKFGNLFPALHDISDKTKETVSEIKKLLKVSLFSDDKNQDIILHNSYQKNRYYTRFINEDALIPPELTAQEKDHAITMNYSPDYGSFLSNPADKSNHYANKVLFSAANDTKVARFLENKFFSEPIIKYFSAGDSDPPDPMNLKNITDSAAKADKSKTIVIQRVLNAKYQEMVDFLEKFLNDEIEFRGNKINLNGQAILEHQHGIEIYRTMIDLQRDVKKHAAIFNENVQSREY